MMARLLVVMGLLLAGVGYAGGQSTVIGKHADFMITKFFVKNFEQTDEWPDALVARVNFNLLNKDLLPNREELVPRSKAILTVLEYALMQGYWEDALYIREQIAALAASADDDLDQGDRHPGKSKGGCRH